jgi:hypothetical protein
LDFGSGFDSDFDLDFGSDSESPDLDWTGLLESIALADPIVVDSHFDSDPATDSIAETTGYWIASSSTDCSDDLDSDCFAVGLPRQDSHYWWHYWQHYYSHYRSYYCSY